MEQNHSNHVCVLKTGRLHEHDLAINALKDNNIPHYKEMETSSGLRLAMPFQPEMGSGTFYSILVPEQAVSDAKNILNELPIDLTTDPEIWHFRPNEKVKRFWKIFIWINLTFGLLFLIVYLINL